MQGGCHNHRIVCRQSVAFDYLKTRFVNFTGKWQNHERFPHKRTLVSKKRPPPSAGIGLAPVELEIGRYQPVKGMQPLYELFARRLSHNTEFVPVRDVDFYFVTFPQFQRLDDRAGKADSETVTPLCNAHRFISKIYKLSIVYLTLTYGKEGSTP